MGPGTEFLLHMWQPLQINYYCYYYYAVGRACVRACVLEHEFLQCQLCSCLTFTTVSDKAQVRQQEKQNFPSTQATAGMHCYL